MILSKSITLRFSQKLVLKIVMAIKMKLSMGLGIVMENVDMSMMRLFAKCLFTKNWA
jgi:hypothetical protein